MADLNRRDELKYIRVVQSAVTGVIEDTKESIDAGAEKLAEVIAEREPIKITTSFNFDQYRDMYNANQKAIEDAFRQGVEVTTNRYEDAIKALKDKLLGLQDINEGLNTQIQSILDKVKETSDNVGKGGLKEIMTLGVVGVGILVGGLIIKEVVD